jgi:hypothetical protein
MHAGLAISQMDQSLTGVLNKARRKSACCFVAGRGQ